MSKIIINNETNLEITIPTKEEPITNRQICDEIRVLGDERRRRRDAVIAECDKLWNEYKSWREDVYRPNYAALRAGFTDNRLAKQVAREQRAQEKAEAEELKRKAKEAKEAEKQEEAVEAETPVAEAAA